jgi:acyl-CoA dehydrogenase
LLAEFFEAKGLAALKEEDRREEWYPDWIEFQGRHGLYAGLLTPKQYSNRGGRFDLRKYTRFLEAFAYFSPAHAYSLHVSFLGLFPILISDNEPLKREAVARLEAGGLFGFGVSERDHGSDLLSTQFMLRSDGSGSFAASGSKYYIGNANEATMISVLGKEIGPTDEGPNRRSPFVFFVLRPREAPAFRSIQKIRTHGIRTAFVADFAVKEHRVPGTDLICCGREAWEAAFGTVDFGKYFLGFGSVGICERAFAEAFAHLRKRILYGKSVTAMPHIRLALAGAFARLTAMKVYAYRALDYLQAAGPDDRRYLLFNAVQKARVSTEGVKVMGLLSECIGARGFDADTFFEMALREAPLIPGLEGSTHINFALTAQFIDHYFADPADGPPPAASVTLGPDDPEENPYWFGTRDRHPKHVRFPPYLDAYVPLRHVPNVRTFVKQVRGVRRLFAGEGVDATAVAIDPGLLIATGKCFSVVAYAQLVAENCTAARVEPGMVSLIFQGLIEDLSGEAIRLAALYPPGGAQRAMLQQAVRVPRTAAVDVEAVFGFVEGRFAG